MIFFLLLFSLTPTNYMAFFFIIIIIAAHAVLPQMTPDTFLHHSNLLTHTFFFTLHCSGTYIPIVWNI